MLTNKFNGLTKAFCLLVPAGWLLLTGCTPPGPRALLKGEQLLREGRYDQAIERLSVAAKLLPRNAQAWNHLGLAYHHAQQPQLAERAYTKALEVDHKLNLARYNLGCLQLEQTNLAGAVRQLTSYTLVESSSMAGWLKLASAHYRARQLDEAERCYRAVLELQPRQIEALNGYGLVLAQRRRPLDALAWFNAALAQDTNYGPALFNLAVVTQQQLNNRSAAVARYRQYAALLPRPADADAVESLARELQGDAPPAVAKSVATNAAAAPALAVAPKPLPPPVAAPPPGLTAVTRSNLPVTPPGKPATTLASAAVRPASEPPKPAAPPAPAVEVTQLPDETAIRPADVFSANVGNAATATDTAKPPRRNLLERLNPFSGRAPARTNSAPITSATDVSNGRPVNLPAVTEQGGLVAARTPEGKPWPRYPYLSPARPAAGNRKSAEPLFSRAARAQQEGQNAPAVVDYQAALQADPAYYEAYFNQGVALAEMHDHRQALVLYEYALVLRPDSVDARYNFALALKAAGFAPDAANELQKILQDRPAESRARFTLANLLAQQLQQPRLAREQYLKLLETDPRHPEAARIRYWLVANP